MGDNALKPTSVLTTTAVQDRARVIAHLSEPAPIRLLRDLEGLQVWAANEMAEGVLDALEKQIIQGNGTGENMTGILAVAGTVPVAFATDAPATLRKALTAMQTAGETPNAVVLHSTDAEGINLTRWGTAGGFLTGGFANDTGNGFGTSANIFGPEITRVISPNVPAGTAVLGDWQKLRLYVREAVNILLDMSGDLFTHNQFIARGEGRFGIGVLRPSAFAVVDLTARRHAHRRRPNGGQRRQGAAVALACTMGQHHHQPRHLQDKARRVGGWPQVAAGAVNVWDEDSSGEWLEISDCAKRMGVTPERVLDLVRRRALRTRQLYGVTLVQPAILSGAVDFRHSASGNSPHRRGI